MMPPDYSHLQAKTAAQLKLPDEERIRIIRQGNFVELPRFKAIFRRLDDLLTIPSVTRSPGILIVAPANNGKSSILERFLAKANGSPNPDQEVAEIRAVYINAPAAGDRASFYQSILDAMFTVYKPSARWQDLSSQVRRTFKLHGVKVLLLDELHDVQAGTPNQQNLFNIELKQLMNLTKVSVVAAGLLRAPALFHRDEQLTSRFNKIDLDPFKPNAELGQLLATLERRIPLRHASNLKDEKIVAEVARRAEGGIGDIYSLIAHCAIDAIERKAEPERITLTSIREADWQRPTYRAAFTRHGRDVALAQAKAADEAFAREQDGRFAEPATGSESGVGIAINGSPVPEAEHRRSTAKNDTSNGVSGAKGKPRAFAKGTAAKTGGKGRSTGGVKSGGVSAVK